MKITINTQKSSREDIEKLKDYLSLNNFDFEAEEEEQEPKYILSEDGILIVGSHGITLNEKIRQEELHEYYITERKEFISELISWIAEASRDSKRVGDKQMMKDDLEMLMDWKDDYILTSNSTNSYIHQGDSEFNETCEELIALNETL